jgi:hypothetical protein
MIDPDNRVDGKTDMLLYMMIAPFKPIEPVCKTDMLLHMLIPPF